MFVAADSDGFVTTVVAQTKTVRFGGASSPSTISCPSSSSSDPSASRQMTGSCGFADRKPDRHRYDVAHVAELSSCGSLPVT